MNMIKVHLFGNYTHRQPLAYPPIRKVCSDSIIITDEFHTADIIIISHTKDLIAYGNDLKRRLGQYQKLVLLSEEPFWDSVWSTSPLERQATFMTSSGPLHYNFLNHHTSNIYDFIHIPYFLLTSDEYTLRYAKWFTANAQMTLTHWRKHFEDAGINIVFLAEYRHEERFNVSYPEGDVLGLSTLRTQFALEAEPMGKIINGTGWHEGYRRQQLADWHLDKFQSYNRKCRFFSSIENTHQPNYISEKIFDSYAMGATPIYIASPQHRITQFAPENTWINLWNVAPEQLNDILGDFHFDDNFLVSYAMNQLRMAQLFSNTANKEEELLRLRKSIIEELQK